MPRINRIRVANIKYDHNKKQMPDLTFELEGQDAIFLLANGGGKSLLVQLILQTVLPNERMGKRRVADLLETDSYTGHVAVEWLLDSGGAEEYFLCTGFCFKEGRGNQRLNYYNYLFDYIAGGEFTISSLPFIKDEDLLSRRRPIGFLELKDWLQEHQVQIFSKNYEYQNRLKEYLILPKEWENISQTNAAEGGVDDFFARSKTASQLVDNLLIPSVKEVLFGTQNGEDELFAAFSEYRTKLLRMPKIKANIQDFSLISSKAEEIIKEVEDLNRLKEQTADQKEQLAKLGKKFMQNIKETESRLKTLTEEKEEALIEEHNLRWKEESYQVFLKQLEYSQLKQELEDKQQLKKHLTEELTELRRKQDELEALRLFNQAQQAKEKEKQHRYQLELLDNKEPELEKKLRAAKEELAWAWQQKEELLSSQEEKLQEELEGLEAEIEAATKEIKKIEIDREDLISRQAALINWLDGFHQTEQKLISELGVSDLGHPQEVLAQKETELAQVRNQQEVLDEEIEELADSSEDLNERRVELTEERSAAAGQIYSLEEKLADFKQEQDRITGLLASQDKYITDLFEQKDEAVSFSRRRLEEIKSSRANLQAKIANLKEKWALVADKDYYLPHNQLLQIKRLLEDESIYTVLGSEWLANQELPVADKEAYINHQPLLPYSILVEENQLSAVKKALQRKELDQGFPLLFLIRNTENLAQQDVREGFSTLLDDNLAVYQPESNRIFTSPSAFTDFKANLEDEIKAKEEKLIEYRSQEEFFIELNQEIKRFYRDYQVEQIEDWKAVKEELVARRVNLKEQLQKIEQEQEELKGLKKKQETRRQTLQDKAVRLKQEQQRLDDFMDDYQLQNSKELELNKVKQKLTELKERLAQLKEDKDRLIERRLTNRQRLNEVYNQQEEHQQEYLDYSLEEVEAVSKVESPYSEVKSQVDELEQRLSQKQGERESIKELIKNYADKYEERMDRIDEIGIDVEWLQENKRKVSKQQLQKLKQEYQTKEKEVKKQQEIVDEVRSRVQIAQGEVNSLTEQLEKEFEREPYLQFSSTGHQEEITTIRQQLEEITAEIEELEREIRSTKEWQRINQEASDDLKYELGADLEEFWSTAVPLSDSEWQKLDSTPKEALRREKKELNRIKDNLSKQEKVVDNRFRNYVNRLRSSQNPNVRQFTSNIEQIMQDGKIYNYDYVESRFLNILEGFEEYQKQYERDLEENERNLEHLTNQSFRRAKTMYENIMELPKTSRIDLYGRRVPVIKIDWKGDTTSQGREAIYNYLQQVLVDLQQLKEEGADDDELDKKMEERLKIRNLVNVIAPIEDCRIRVLKPRKESILKESQLDYSDWSEVARWSGGEGYSIYMTMFMVMITYIRRQTAGRSDVWKTVIADNPFGKASSPHILNTVFEVARANRIQLICLTAHRQENILLEFPIAYSLQLRNACGKEVMQVEELESGFYNLSKA